MRRNRHYRSLSFLEPLPRVSPHFLLLRDLIITYSITKLIVYQSCSLFSIIAFNKVSFGKYRLRDRHLSGYTCFIDINKYTWSSYGGRWKHISVVSRAALQDAAGK